MSALCFVCGIVTVDTLDCGHGYHKDCLNTLTYGEIHATPIKNGPPFCPEGKMGMFVLLNNSGIFKCTTCNKTYGQFTDPVAQLTAGGKPIHIKAYVTLAPQEGVVAPQEGISVMYPLTCEKDVFQFIPKSKRRTILESQDIRLMVSINAMLDALRRDIFEELVCVQCTCTEHGCPGFYVVQATMWNQMKKTSQYNRATTISELTEYLAR